MYDDRQDHGTQNSHDLSSTAFKCGHADLRGGDRELPVLSSLLSKFALTVLAYSDTALSFWFSELYEIKGDNNVGRMTLIGFEGFTEDLSTT